MDEQFERLHSTAFIENDPISIPHSFIQKEDIEISGFLTSILSWGQRKSILTKSRELMLRMDNSPFEYIMNSNESDLKQLNGFVYRTFNETDCITMINSLKMIYLYHGGLETVFTKGFSENGAYGGITALHHLLFSYPHLIRTRKHIANPETGSAAKRLNMFLRWMVRKNEMGIDFGIWNNIKQADLVCPLDIHSGRTARKLGILKRPSNDWKAAIELTNNLKTLDAQDPTKYDFVLFGLGIEGFSND